MWQPNLWLLWRTLEACWFIAAGRCHLVVEKQWRDVKHDFNLHSFSSHWTRITSIDFFHAFNFNLTWDINRMLKNSTYFKCNNNSTGGGAIIIAIINSRLTTTTTTNIPACSLTVKLEKEELIVFNGTFIHPWHHSLHWRHTQPCTEDKRLGNKRNPTDCLNELFFFLTFSL